MGNVRKATPIHTQTKTDKKQRHIKFNVTTHAASSTQLVLSCDVAASDERTTSRILTAHHTASRDMHERRRACSTYWW